MKIKPAPMKMIKVIVITGLVCVVITLIPGIIMGCLDGFSYNSFISTFAVIIASIIFSICSYTRAAYYLDDKGITQQYLLKKKFFPYEHIAYIDDIRSKRVKSLIMYMDNGQQIILVMDKNGKLLYELQARATNKLSRVEFLKKYPKIQLG